MNQTSKPVRKCHHACCQRDVAEGEWYCSGPKTDNHKVFHERWRAETVMKNAENQEKQARKNSCR